MCLQPVTQHTAESARGTGQQQSFMDADRHRGFRWGLPGNGLDFSGIFATVCASTLVISHMLSDNYNCGEPVLQCQDNSDQLEENPDA